MDSNLLCIINIYLINPLAITVMFSESTYNVSEDGGPAQLKIVLSNPSSTDVTVQVTTNDGSATGE